MARKASTAEGADFLAASPLNGCQPPLILARAFEVAAAGRRDAIEAPVSISDRRLGCIGMASKTEDEEEIFALEIWSRLL